MAHAPGPLLAIALLSLCNGSDAGAGDSAPPPPVRAGDRVRFAAAPGPRRWTSASVVDVEADTLVVRLRDGGPATRVPLASVRALEVSRGRRRAVAEGALVGALPGLVIGAYLGHGHGCEGQARGCSLVPSTLIGAVGVGAETAGLGALAGLLFRKERWERVDVADGRPRVEVRPALVPFGGAGIAVRF